MKIYTILLFVLFTQVTNSTKSQTILEIDTTVVYATPPAFGNGAKYNCFSDAVEVLNNTALSPAHFPIHFNVMANQAFYEKTQIAALKKAGLDDSKRIVFKRVGEGTNPVIIPKAGNSLQDYGIQLLGADYVCFDGIDIRQGLDTDRNIDDQARIEFGYLITNNETDGAQKNEIKNCTVTLNKADQYTIGIYQRNTNTTATTASNNSFNVYNSCSILNAYNGIVLRGSSVAADYEKGCAIVKCKIGDKALDKIGCLPDIAGPKNVYGILMENEGEFLITECLVQDVAFDSDNEDGYVFGIDIKSALGTNYIYSNRVREISNSHNGGEDNGVVGIQLSGEEKAVMQVYNNFVSQISNSSNIGALSVATFGIKLSGDADANILNNSISFSPGFIPHFSPSALIYIAASGKVKLNNNILKNYINSPNVKTYCVYSPGEDLHEADYNIYDCSAVNNSYTGYYNGDMPALSDWQSATGKDVNSKQFIVPFISATDLYINSGPDDINYLAPSIMDPLVYADIDNKIRNYAYGTNGAALLRPMNTKYIIPCDEVISKNCNYIVDNTFHINCDITGENPPPSYVYDPFVQTECHPVLWAASHGSPQLVQNDGSEVEIAGNDYALMAVLNFRPPGNINQNILRGEGIITRIPKLIPGTAYSISFFEKFAEFLNFPDALPAEKIDEINIRLLHCADYQTLIGGDYWQSELFPPVPTNSQLIYCETSLNSKTWKHIIQSFSPNDDYDMVWIYPKHYGQPLVSEGGIYHFAVPEIVEYKVTAGGDAFPSQPDCIASIGEANPICPVPGAVYEWHHGSTVIQVTPTNQQIQIDASIASNTGIWTLYMYPPESSASNSTCSDAPVVVQASVTVHACGCIKLPRVF